MHINDVRKPLGFLFETKYILASHILRSREDMLGDFNKRFGVFVRKRRT